MTSPATLAPSAYSNRTNEDMVVEINLGDYIAAGEKVIGGRDAGERIRWESQLDERIKEIQGEGKVIIQLPSQVRSISPAFLEGLLYGAVRLYGRTGLLERVAFTEAQRYDVTDDLEEAIDRIITEKNALAY